MYILKNAWRNVLRFKGRNILVGIIIVIVTISCCVSLSIKSSSDTLISSYKDNNKLSVSFTLDPMSLKNATDEEKNNFEILTVDAVKEYADSNYVSGYYYTLETSADSDTINAVDYSDINSDDSNNSDNNQDENKPEKIDQGDFRITAYSDFSYLEDFVDGTKKITKGAMVTADSDMEAVISEDLADENNVSVGDSISLYITTDTDNKQSFKVVGIYKDTTDVNTDSIGGNMMNSRNQIYTSITSIQKFNLDSNSSSTKSMMNKNGLTAKFYLKNKNDLSKFKKEVSNKGLSSYYKITTNEDEITSSLKPIKNLTSFSITFLIVTLIVGGIILAVINIINIRERKYEIGVLRAIGMSKKKVTYQLISEILMISMLSFVVGLIGGICLSQPVTNKMLASEIKSYQTETSNIQSNFGGSNFKGGMPGRNNSTLDKMVSSNYIDSLNVKTNGITILYLFLITIGLTSVSGLISMTYINKYEPNKILQNRI